LWLVTRRLKGGLQIKLRHRSEDEQLPLSTMLSNL
jgi:hypothetical protein